MGRRWTTAERTLWIYEDPAGRRPIERWLLRLRDRRAKARVLVRIDRLRLGNPGDCRSLGDGLHELRIDYGPGYRVYFSIPAPGAVLLIRGGTKARQRSDIGRARDCWREFSRDADS